MDIIRYKGQESGYTYEFEEDNKTFIISFAPPIWSVSKCEIINASNQKNL